jgi:hypothetical protein
LYQEFKVWRENISRISNICTVNSRGAIPEAVNHLVQAPLMLYHKKLEYGKYRYGLSFHAI